MEIKGGEAGEGSMGRKKGYERVKGIAIRIREV